MKKSDGITLLSLVVTVIILAILTGITIKTVTGENGLIKRTKNEKNESIRIYQNEENEINQMKNELKVESKQIEFIKKDISYVGYYADMDADGIVDGVIYADLAIGGDGTWFAGSKETQYYKDYGIYTIPKITEGLKEYYISQTNYKGTFGESAVISPKGEGTERFYIMALKDLDEKQNGTEYDWYNAATNMTDYKSTTLVDFGTGKSNTKIMIEKWNNKEYGEQDQCSEGHKDMWGVIQDEVEKGWYIPSRGEWAAFGDGLNIDKSNYMDKGISYWYWTSSQSDINFSWGMSFESGCIGETIVYYGNWVRLGATF